MRNQTLQYYLARHEKILNELIETTIIPATRIRDAIHYALFPGGKRLRPLLVYLCGFLVNAKLESLDIIAAAIECIHCYSLVHDDLPSMDNDDLRRGLPTCHRAFDEATAVLAGDAMQAMAVDILLKYLPQSLAAEKVILVTHELVQSCGPSGMVSGQSLDLTELSQTSVSESQLREIHLLKTGKLISACINMVLYTAHDTEHEHNLREFARILGLVFQMQDDYLDQYANISCLGKGRASDMANMKTTFASLYSKQELHTLITEYYLKARQMLDVFGQRNEQLCQLLDELQFRNVNPQELEK